MWVWVLFFLTIYHYNFYRTHVVLKRSLSFLLFSKRIYAHLQRNFRGLVSWWRRSPWDPGVHQMSSKKKRWPLIKPTYISKILGICFEEPFSCICSINTYRLLDFQVWQQKLKLWYWLSQPCYTSQCTTLPNALPTKTTIAPQKQNGKHCPVSVETLSQTFHIGSSSSRTCFKHHKSSRGFLVFFVGRQGPPPWMPCVPGGQWHSDIVTRNSCWISRDKQTNGWLYRLFVVKDFSWECRHQLLSNFNSMMCLSLYQITVANIFHSPHTWTIPTFSTWKTAFRVE